MTTRLAITPGEPAGIGPDITLQLNPNGISSTLIVIADLAVLEARAELLGLPTDFNVVEDPRRAVHGRLNVLPLSAATPVTAGQMDAKNSPYVINCLEQAVQLCEAKDCSGIVTGPINKAAINEAGIKFSGHTEWLAERTSTEKVVMMLATTKLRVALVTTHLPLRAVPDAITKSEVTQTINILNQDLQHRFGLVQPRILVCGLNPHAGEGGYLGHEEIEVIEPCLELAREQGINVVGPLPADTAFTLETLDGADAVLAMYHDQGLPVLKHQGFGDAVNVTLGLPIIRTSVDHGTALDIAGQGKADSGSMLTAIKVAEQMSQSQKTAS
jgi:4-hydroxythreonine-4-phosphate dehydrogenase